MTGRTGRHSPNASTPAMNVTKTIDETRKALAGSHDLALVPTMGALHEGHLANIRRARELCGRVAVSVFVNPTQFGPGEDYDNYPRTLPNDLKQCEAEGVDLVFTPDVDEIYPPDCPETIVDVPSLTQDLEGAHRPGHFQGVCRVVAKLLAIVQPHVACFGRKDYQQLKVIEAMAADLCLPVRIEAVDTVREADGLALSSRNAYLADEQRQRALGLSKALTAAEQLIREDGETDPQTVEHAMEQEMRAHRVEPDYAAVRDARTLGQIDLINPDLEPVVCLVAGNVDHVRLIDNRLLGEEK